MYIYFGKHFNSFVISLVQTTLFIDYAKISLYSAIHQVLTSWLHFRLWLSLRIRMPVLTLASSSFTGRPFQLLWFLSQINPFVIQTPIAPYSESYASRLLKYLYHGSPILSWFTINFHLFSMFFMVITLRIEISLSFIFNFELNLRKCILIVPLTTKSCSTNFFFLL